jgi:hypothetical protein
MAAVDRQNSKHVEASNREDRRNIMLKKTLMTAAAALAITVGATTISTPDANAGVRVNLSFGGYGGYYGGHGYYGHRHYRHRHYRHRHYRHYHGHH